MEQKASQAGNSTERLVRATVSALCITVVFSPEEQWPVIPSQSTSIFEEYDAIRIKMSQSSIMSPIDWDTRDLYLQMPSV